MELELKKPRVRDKGASGEDAIKFSSWILPRYLRRSKSIDQVLTDGLRFEAALLEGPAGPLVAVLLQPKLGEGTASNAS